MMCKEERYSRWLLRQIGRLPEFLKTIAIDTSKLLRKPYTAIMVGANGIFVGIIAIILIVVSPLWISFFLTITQWEFVILISFFLLTHGIYRAEKR